ncbi:hypothetical protein FGIG_09308 [Fasciola gigantica]|uniref:Uncharacterized protein n=1 Tax=Fasciola gigantica TaxID=46835 RepID=A0A504Z8E5_FASGI|nr:hypothetical protein FGIG_09308 [Fasciola gigantica]
MNATSLTGASPVNPEAQTSAMADTYSTIAHGGPTESSNIGSDHVKESTSDEFKSKTEIDRESVDPKKAVDNIISEPSDRAELENKQFASETTETPTEKAINDVQLRQSDIQAKPSSPAATEPEKTALKPTEVEDEKLKLQPTASNISDEVTAGASALVSPGSSQQPLDKGCHSEPAMGNREIKPSEKIYKENLDSIETIHSDGTVSVVPAHPPSAEADELPTEQKEMLAAAPTETSSEGLTHSDELDNTVLQNTTASVSQSSNSQITNHEQEPNDKLAGTITEPIMHVIDPCTEVPEPVGTPQTSRSKISESHGGDNGPELNVAHLVDAVDVREATEEDIPPLKPVTPKATQHVDRPKRPPPPVIMTAAHGISDNGEKTKKSHGGFHFRLGKSKSRENSSTREGSPDHHQRRTIGASMRSAFGTLTRSLKQKQSDLSGRKRTPGDAPINGHFSRPPPPGMDQIQATVQRHHQSDQEEQSLQSVSGVCLSHESVSSLGLSKWKYLG